MLPEPLVRDWLFASWVWLRKELPPVALPRLVTPASLCAPAPPALGHARARDYLTRVCAAAGVSVEPYAVVADHTDGHIGADAKKDVVPYAEWALEDPAVLVAHMATGLARHLVSSCERAPEEPETVEMTAELYAVYLGFGVFLANVPSRVSSLPSLGLLGMQPAFCALGEQDLSYALAIWAWTNEIPDADVSRHLMPNPRAFYTVATRDLRRRGRELEALRRASEPCEVGPYR